MPGEPAVDGKPTPAQEVVVDVQLNTDNVALGLDGRRSFRLGVLKGFRAALGEVIPAVVGETDHGAGEALIDAPRADRVPLDDLVS